jgi:hypothetical protein
MVAPADAPVDRIHDEYTFHYLLSLQRRRSERSTRPFMLLLVELAERPDRRIPRALSSQIFRALRNCLRETDFIGWYQDGVAAAAVLTELGDGAAADASQPVRERITAAIAECLPPADAARFVVATYQLRPTLKS